MRREAREVTLKPTTDGPPEAEAVSRAAAVADIVESTRRLIASAVLFSHQVAERLGLGATDSQFMTLLEVHGPLTPGRLADLTGLRTGTVTGVLDRLESAGFIRRDRDPHDRRKVIVSLDEQAVRDRVSPHYAAPADDMTRTLAAYDDAQLALIAGFLKSITTAPGN